MKTRAFILILAVQILILAGAAFGQGNREPKRLSSPAALRYEIVITNAGTRSEGQVGRLFIGETEITGRFRFIDAFGVRYVYTASLHPWGWSGFMPQTPPEPRDGETEAFTDADAQKRWYQGQSQKPKSGTPYQWLFLQDGDQGIWIEAGAIAQYLADNPVKESIGPVLRE